MRFGHREGVKERLRAKALGKLAQLCSKQEPAGIPEDDENKGDSLELLTHSLPVYYSTNTSKLYTIPITLNEWEVLVALCECTPGSSMQAERLIKGVIGPYFLASPRQRMSETLEARFKLKELRQPNELLTLELIRFLIVSCSKYPRLTKMCSVIIDQYLREVSSLFNKRCSAVFSLVGFLNAFIMDNSALQLTQTVWKKLAGLFGDGSFVLLPETRLLADFSGEVTVRYHEANKEISNSLFLNLMAQLQVSLASKIVALPKDATSLSEYLLQVHSKNYMVQQEGSADRVDMAASEELYSTLTRNRPILTEMSHFAFKHSINIEDLDLSTDVRAAYSFNTRAFFLDFLCLILFFDNAVSDLGQKFLQLVSDSIDKFLLSEIVSPKLVRSILCAGALLNFFTEETSLTLLRLFPALVSSPQISNAEVARITKIFTFGLMPLNEDAVVSTVYSINNLLTLGDDGIPVQAVRERQLTNSTVTSTALGDHELRGRAGTSDTIQAIHNISNRMALSSTENNGRVDEVTSATYHHQLFRNCITTMITIASHYGDQAITALTITVLTQKVSVISKELDAVIIDLLAELVSNISITELALLLKFYKPAYSQAKKQENKILQESICEARIKISEIVLSKRSDSDLYRFTLANLLDSITACGEVEQSDLHRTDKEIARCAEDIGAYLRPLAAILPKPGSKPFPFDGDEALIRSFRNIWFNMIIHGFRCDSQLVEKHYSCLLTIAYNSPPLASDFPSSNKEVSLDMNAVLRRHSSNAIHKQQKQAIAGYLSTNPVQARTLSMPKIMFLAATALLETLRCEAGDCSKILRYYCDPSVVSSSIDKFIEALNLQLISKYTSIVQSKNSSLFGSLAIAHQLNDLLLHLAHRNRELQNAAFQSCDIFIKTIPSSLCHHHSLYTLLDLMTTLFDSVVDCETNKFQPHYEFVLKHSGTKVLIPDSALWRKTTLSRLHASSKDWVRIILDRANEDTKILLQSYISDLTHFDRSSTVEYGVSFAMEMAGSISLADEELSKLTYVGRERPSTIAAFISQHSWRSKNLVDTAIISSPQDIAQQIGLHVQNIRRALAAKEPVSFKDITTFLDLSAASLLLGKFGAASLVYDLVHIPFSVFTSSAIKMASNIWLTVIKERPDIAHMLLVEVGYCWMKSIDDRRGLYSRDHDLAREENQMMEYAPYNKTAINRDALAASQSLQPHRHVIKFFKSHFEGTSFQSDHLLDVFTRWTLHGLNQLKEASMHPFARMARHDLLNFALSLLQVHSKQKTDYVPVLAKAITNSGLSWFRRPIAWPFGSNQLKIKADLSGTVQFYSELNKLSALLIRQCGSTFKLLQFFLLSEIWHIETWLAPLQKIVKNGGAEPNAELLKTAFIIDPQLALNLFQRYPTTKLDVSLTSLVLEDPLMCVGVPEILDLYLLSNKTGSKATDMHFVVYWCPVNPLKSINFFLPPWNDNTFILQYAVFSLESHDVNVTFFYVPQIVQCLRYDRTGYVTRLILDTANTSVLFAHQIIWNMLANSYKDDEGLEEDPIKPTLDGVRKAMISAFASDKFEFYEREFGFFNEVTGISGKLKPFIKKSKAEKKHKIDEEMSAIQLEPDVYLPSNPDGVVVDIDRKSGKPLQSHAKAPFMATFKIKKTIRDSETGRKKEIQQWQAAIFKVGDDCRQDVLALQLISMFRTIWSNIGLDIYVFPNRVTATAPGCGVIDVLPNSISRDMLGREAVNGLYEYFVTKFGREDTIEFQNARNNFVKSLAGYSVISYLLQFKDRHNGNIMYDDQGHCLHIDFGFIFDIVPGGVKFEAVPFKLTKEMVKVMGGSQDTQAYRDFEELCVKAYLAARPHMAAIIECVKPMLDSSMPCFKGLKTIKNLQNRFQPLKTDHEAALFMKSLIRKSYESLFTKGYDEFQRLTNGIPY
ncbi:hypothetical protein HG536_0E05670 [Torulaspora globosa]|uniref:1-phosphatidylinositol 4-kinase n=1 Tax=Torulaspora globosa TaxID=48254 RepID=A0A7G3ZJH0_9SACH|nr:uncharacterized protein HG536_0E05670 [Torulaspora globosa]QLL33656.1 hypothetical protein HG536_0E05670 [Torulaspora globosa]